MPKPKLRLVEIDDWCCLYKDGKDIYQGHSLSLSRFFDVLEENGISPCVDFAVVQGGKQDQETAHDQGQLPQNVVGLKDTDIS